MLDRTAEITAQTSRSRTARRGTPRVERQHDCAPCGAWLRSVWHFFVSQSFSSLTRRIVFLNLAGLRRAGHRRSLSVAVPRRPDRRARAEPAGARRDHRRRDCRLRHGRNRRHHDRSGHGFWNCRPAKATAHQTNRSPASNSRSIRNASRRCCAAWSRRPRRARASTTAMAC